MGNTSTSSSSRIISTLKSSGTGERREVFQFLEQQDWFLDLPLKPNGINNNLLRLLSLTEERKEVFQFLEPFLDLLLKPNGTNNNLLRLLSLMGERKGVFQFPE